MIIISGLAKLERKMAEQNHLLWRLTNLYPDCEHKNHANEPWDRSSVLELLQKHLNTG